MSFQYQVDGAAEISIHLKLEGGASMVALLWYDEAGPGFWHLEPRSVSPGEASWVVGPLGAKKGWTANAQSKPEAEARGPYTQKTFLPGGRCAFSFYLETGAASNTGAHAPYYVAQLTVTQNEEEVASAGEQTPFSFKPKNPSEKTAYIPKVVEFYLT